jgi:hypothetical protein
VNSSFSRRTLLPIVSDTAVTACTFICWSCSLRGYIWND